MAYYIRRRRHIDRCARMVRHSDDIRDVALKIKQKASELIDRFKRYTWGQKIAISLAKLVKILSVLYAVKNIKDTRDSIRLLKAWEAGARAYFILMGKKEELEGVHGNVIDIAKVVVMRQGYKLVMALVATLIAQLTEKVAKAGLPGDYNEKNYPNG